MAENVKKQSEDVYSEAFGAVEKRRQLLQR